MTDGGNPLFTTKARSIQTDGELKWGGDDGERWEDAIEDSTHVRVGADGEITTSSRPESGVSRWTCNDTDTETGTAIDVWGSNDGSIGPGVTTGYDGRVDDAYYFDGGTDAVVEVDAPVDSVENVTYSFWVNFQTQDRWDTGAGPDRFHLGYNKSAQEVLAGLGTDYSFINADITQNEWHLFTLVGDSGTGIVYVDGEALPDDKNNFSYGYGSAFPETFGLGKRLGDYLFTRRESRRLRRA